MPEGIEEKVPLFPFHGQAPKGGNDQEHGLNEDGADDDSARELQNNG